MQKTVGIEDLLTPLELERALAHYKALKGTGLFAATIDAEILAPNMERINKALGQENNSRFLAYAVEFVFMNAEVK